MCWRHIWNEHSIAKTPSLNGSTRFLIVDAPDGEGAAACHARQSAAKVAGCSGGSPRQ